ncbi:MAG: hypothetical protein ACJA1Z_000490 [Patiriisocius sp.]|jgi:hypothetical protein
MSFLKKITYLFILLVIIIACKSDDDNVTEDPKAENRKALGTSAEDLLSSETFKSLTVELVYSQGFRPSQETLDSFQEFILNRVNKTDGVKFVENIVPEQPGAPFTIEEIRDIEENIRTEYTVGDDIAVYVFFSNGNNINDTSTTVTLGTAYQNTSLVVYQRTLQQITENEPENLPLLEVTTLNHEFGHLFGLVNIQNDDIHPGDTHEDPLRAKHCVVEECLMYFEALNITRIMERLRSRRGQVAQLDPLCIEDLQAKGGK